jgi:hypothetical protein
MRIMSNSCTYILSSLSKGEKGYSEHKHTKSQFWQFMHLQNAFITTLLHVAFDARFNQNLSEIELRSNLIGFLFSGCLILFTLCYMRIGNIFKLSIFTKITFVKSCYFPQLKNIRISFLLVFNWWKIYFINHCTSKLIFYFIRSHFYNKRYCLFDHRLNIKKNEQNIFIFCDLSTYTFLNSRVDYKVVIKSDW